MLIAIEKFFKEAKYRTKRFFSYYSEEITIFCVAYTVLGLLITGIIFAHQDNREEEKAYCNWTPNRYATYIWWAVEYPARKTTCLIWSPLE